MSLNIALTGLGAATNNLDVISNNLANANTTGFKRSRAEFGDMVARNTALNVATSEIGIGVRLQGVSQQFNQGSIGTTNNELDLAINGAGFFQVSDSSGSYYTRAGNFHLDQDGYVVNSANQNLTGYVLSEENELTSNPGNLSVNRTLAPTATASGLLKVPVGFTGPKITTEGQIGVNLDGTQASATLTFDSADPGTYHYSTSVVAYDDLGDGYALSFYFTKVAQVPDQWEFRAMSPGSVASGGTASGGVIASGVLGFTTNGLLDVATSGGMTATFGGTMASGTGTPPGGTFTISSGFLTDGGRSASQSLALDLRELTNFAGDYEVRQLSQNGYAQGGLSGIDVADDGTVYGLYSNGQSLEVGRVLLATFPNIQGLKPIGETAWMQTIESGEAQLGTPGSSGRGDLVSSALEASNVDMTKELVDMIVAQRSFQANTQVVNTDSTLFQGILNIR